ncbi:hypothetical protein FA10DRAFT_165475 [Acaromyces ingoldii]|uniref:TPR-like protein n=1 Tax=Acaromyces ingoldii TaxID=215250 RepID=A0A316YH53_9BASI|nr:hypothetical protein FA10DRAFT_165475 [Acaromyces ingoldii]PWN88529.1 hypothetical protein FA10DRAFT_165475 [Acaromyces ingoldii]
MSVTEGSASSSSASPSTSSSPSLNGASSATSADLPPSPTLKEASLPPQERNERALKLKDEGNKLFVSGDFENAKIRYGEGIALDPTVVVLWSNRAACELKLEQHGLAIEDAKPLSWMPSLQKPTIEELLHTFRLPIRNQRCQIFVN